MSWMFATTEDFTSDLSTWDVSKVTSMAGMFHNAKSFNGSLS
jgi:surface protein